MKREFDCEACGQRFSTQTTGAEMEAEYQRLYGHSQAAADEESVSVCDACYAIAIAAHK